MTYQALYRSWRPQTFRDLVGQPHVKQTLVNAIERGQVAHAYLFSGPRGTGKTSAAKVLAKAMNCLSPDGSEPCNHCPACQSINDGTSVDVEEIDAASNRGVDEIRQLRDKVQYAPAVAKRKVYIIDEVHMLTTEAFNALLKTLEEPPGHTVFVLATTEPHRIPATIVSRCQRFDFRRIAPETIVARLRQVCKHEGWRYEDDALWKISQAADGGLRDALGLLEQTVAFGQGEVSAENAAHVMGGVTTSALIELIRALHQRQPLAVMERLMDWYAAGKDAGRIVHDILQVLRDLFIVKLSQQESEIQARQGYLQLANECDAEWLLEAVRKLGETYVHLRFVDQPRIALESALLTLIPAVKPSPVAVEPPSAPPSDAADAKRRQASAPSGQRPAPTVSGSLAASRKLEVLRKLYAEADATRLDAVRANWDAILTAVRERRIQTHAWLINGEAVLATADTVVLAFSSRIHRDAVMKPEERSTIQAAMEAVLGEAVQVLALLQADWESFGRHLGTAASEERQASPEDAQDELVDRVIQIFGKDVVEVRPEE